jgi:choloylglycine hydrolase
MKKFAAFLLTAFFLLNAFSTTLLACTTFCLKNKGEVLFGKNYDWMIGDGLIFVNKRGVAKVGTAGRNAASWVSKYGSVTFNQYGWENPSGGMNEAGLVIELMWLDDTRYPKTEGKPTVDVLEWIQYQLDTAATTAEVIKNSDDIQIDARPTLHYLVSDKSGNAATIEFLNGKLTPHTGDSLPVATLTNDTYEKSLEFAKNTEPVKAQGAGSLQRFTRAAEKTKEFDKKPKSEKEAVDYAFSILSDVAQPNYTQWSIVYDQKRGRIYFRSLQSPQIKSIDAKSFDYSCAGAVKLFDVNAKSAGDVTALFKDRTREANRDLIERAFNGTEFLKNIPASVKDKLAVYPEEFSCSTGEPKKEDKLKASTGQMSYMDLAFPLYYIYKQIAS